MSGRINDFIDWTDYHPSYYGDGVEPYFEYNFECPKCGKHIFGRTKPTECECGFKHYTDKERIEFLEDAVTELTTRLSELTKLVADLSKIVTRR